MYIDTVVPQYPWGIDSKYQYQITKSKDVKTPYIKWCSICIQPIHILLYTLNHF